MMDQPYEEIHKLTGTQATGTNKPINSTQILYIHNTCLVLSHGASVISNIFQVFMANVSKYTFFML